MTEALTALVWAAVAFVLALGVLSVVGCLSLFAVLLREYWISR